MRRLLLFATLFSALLAFAPGAQAAERLDLRQFASTDTAALSLADGRGRATLVRRSGAILGSVREGRIVVKAKRGASPRAALSGCDRRWRPSPRAIVCAGRGLQLSTSADRRVTLRGTRVFVSAVMRGSVTLRGTRGTFSIEGGARGSWPSVARTWSVGG